MKKAAFAAVCVLLSVGTVSAQIPDWTQVTTVSSPSVRSRHAMVYDSGRGKVVMFGGYNGYSGSNLNDTWEHDGVGWTQITTASSPIARHAHGMAYDSVRGKVVMFGGWVGGYLNDTWEYDGVNWTQITTASSPIARKDHAMVYDSVRGKVVMFGGYNGYNGSNLNDTWEYDGVNWTQITTVSSPIARRDHAMVYDSGRGKVVMFGGYGYLNDTWEYDGVGWTQITTASSPIARHAHGMAYDSGRGKVVMFGGYDGGYLNDTWEYDGVNWMQITTASSPGARGWHAMAYDSVRGEVAMFGGIATGNAVLGDTWEYENGPLILSTGTTYGTGCGTPALDFTPTANPVVGTTAGALIANAPNQFAGVTMGWSDSHLSGIPLLPLDLAFIGMPGCSLLHSNDVFGLPVTPLTATTLQFDLPIPFQASLLSTHVYLQAYCLAPGVNPLQIIASNGIDWLIGNQ